MSHAVIICLIVLVISFYPAFITEHKNRHDLVINKRIADALVDRVLATKGKKRDPDKIYRIQVMPDGKGILNIYNKDQG